MKKQASRSVQRRKMKANKFMTILIGVWLFGLLINSASWAQVTPTRLDAIKAKLEHVKALSQKLPEGRRRALSGAAQNLIQLAEGFDKVELGLREAPSRPTGLAEESSNSAEEDEVASVIPVSDPGTDFVFSVLMGFTQSETSTAWCGDNVVVGFNDSGSLPESLFSGPGGISFTGVARSTNRGQSFKDLGFLNPGPNPFDLLASDPVLACSNASTFYYASLFATGTPSTPLSAISVSKSLDGGLTFGNPVVAASKDLVTHFLDKPWMTVDPTNPERIFVTYTDLDFSGVVCGDRVAIELVRSTDGGATWSAPVVIEEVCGPLLAQGSQVAVGPAGEVYIAWELFQADFITRELRIGKSTDNGKNFAPFVKVDNVTPVGDGFALQGGFRAAFEFPSLAVDRSGTGTDGNVYLTWHDGRNLQVPDFVPLSGLYGYADVLISRSSDGGATWSVPVQVNTNDGPLPSGRGTDQYQPGVAVDNTGKAAVCWYDRRLDPSNFLIDRFCGVSTNAGAIWTDARHSSPSWAPIHATDVFIDPFYLGDYDTLASDFTQATPGFIGAFQFFTSHGETIDTRVLVPNPDVKATGFLP